MSDKKRIVEETEEICTSCNGRGQWTSLPSHALSGIADIHSTCGSCFGKGFRVTRRVVRYEEAPITPPTGEEPTR